MLDEIFGDLNQLGFVIDQVLLGLPVGAIDEVAHFDVNLFCDFVAVVPFFADFASQEHQLFPFAEGARAEAGGHAVAFDHTEGGFGGAFDVVAGSGGNFVKDQLFGDPTPHHDAEHVLELVLGPEIPVFIGEQRGVSTHVAAGDDADFVDAVGVGKQPGDEGMTGFVVGGHFFFALTDDAALAFGAGDHALDGFLKVGHEDAGLVLAGGQERGLIDQVGQVGATESGSLAGDDLNFDFIGQGFTCDVDFQDGAATDNVGQVQRYAAVEATGAEQGGVQNVGPVGGGDDDDVGVGFKAVHFNQDLVEGLLAFVVSTAQAGAAVATNGVDFVHEEDARGVALGLFKQVTDAGRADANEHLDEFATGNMEKRHAGFASDGPCQQRFSGAGRTNQEYPLGDAGAESQETFGIFEEIDDFFKLGFGFVHAGHVVKRNRGLVERHHASAAAPEAHGLIVGSLGLAHHQQDEPAEEYQGQEVEQDAEDAAESAGAFVGHFGRSGEAVKVDGFVEQRKEISVFADTAGVLGGLATDSSPRDDGEFFAIHDDLIDLATPHIVEDIGNRKLFATTEARNQRVENYYDSDNDEQIDETVADPAIIAHKAPAGACYGYAEMPQKAGR